MNLAEKTIRQLVLNRIGELAMLAEEVNADESNPLTASAYINTMSITLEFYCDAIPVGVFGVHREKRSQVSLLDSLEERLDSARRLIKEHKP